MSTAIKTVKPKSKKFKPSSIRESVLYSRAMEAVIWGMPVVNYDLMYQAAQQVGASFNQIVYWPGLLDWKNQSLTPNPDVIYLMPFFNTKDAGPIVLEIPPTDDGVINGSVMDCWQVPLEDVGAVGVDKGQGGKFLILPPNHNESLPEGYIAMPSDTYKGYSLLRSILKSGSKEDVAAAVKYAKRVKVYPLSSAADPKETVFADAMDKLFDSTIQYDIRFFESLDRMIQSEPWLTRDKVMIDMLKTIGIEKGKTFQPDLITQEILSYAARDAHAWMDDHYEEGFAPFFEGAHWGLPASPDVVEGMQSFFANPDSYSVDGRGVVYSMAFFGAKHLGEGQFYLMAIKDKKNERLDSRKTYRLIVPPNAPVNQYWSATAYDRSTHAFIRKQKRQGRSSQSPGIQRNEDGSVDIYFGPKAPPGKESNWVPTGKKGNFEVLFRFYGPDKALFEKSWTMEDIEEVDSL